MYDVAIIGSGVAGLSAGLYAGRYELSTIIIGEMLDGATASAWTIENYPGFEEIDGYDLVVKMKEHAEKNGAKVVTDIVISAKKDKHFILSLESGETIEAKSVILTVGSARRKLNLPKEDEFAKGKGVNYCTTCDGPLYKGKTIGIVGGGDAAIKGANLAVQYAEKIHIIEMTDKLKAEPINMNRLQPFIDKGQVELHLNTKVSELLGDDRLKGVKFDNGTELSLDGLFVEIGAIPDASLAENVGAATDDWGYTAVNNNMETNVPGFFAAGDATNFFGHFKQVVTATAMGAVAATSAFKYLGDK